MTKKFTIILSVLLVLTCLLSSCKFSELLDGAANEEKYQKAVEALSNGDLVEAYKLFNELGDYKDAKKKAAKFRYVPTKIKYKDNNDDGKLEEYMTKTITCNEQNLPKQVICNYTADYTGDYKETYDYTYDANGNLIKAVSTYSNNYHITECTYDNNGNLIKQVSTNSDGSKYTSDYTYDANGNRIKKVYTRYSGDKETYDYTYDTDGNLIKEVITYSDGSNNVIEYTYDAKGNPIKNVETYRYSDDKHVTDYIYDASGNCIKMIRTDDGGSKDVYEYTYDASKNCIKEVHTDSSGNKTVYDYTYDANGNRIKYEMTYSSSDFNDKSMLEIEYMLVYIDREFTDEEWEAFIMGTIYR